MFTPYNVMIPCVLAILTWLISLITWNCRRVLCSRGKRLWPKYLLRLIIIQAGILFLLIRMSHGIRAMNLIPLAIHAILIPATVPPYDRRNSDDKFMLRSGIYFILLIIILSIDIVICIITILF